jgi:hypothetical protein
MTYTSHGYMTAADMAEYRQDYDWDELREPDEGEACEHGRLLTDDCDQCPEDDPPGRPE